MALIDVAEGRAPADLVFVNASIVDVYRLRVARGQVAVKFGCIAGVLFEGCDCEDASVPAWEAMRVVDCQGHYLAPGFIDGHLHIRLEYPPASMPAWPSPAAPPPPSPTATRSPTCAASTALRS
ncbi:MAG: hypothetical protein ACLTSX_03090 [Collinsella sp.]